jgi:hypothetical protein
MSISPNTGIALALVEAERETERDEEGLLSECLRLLVPLLGCDVVFEEVTAGAAAGTRGSGGPGTTRMTDILSALPRERQRCTRSSAVFARA